MTTMSDDTTTTPLDNQSPAFRLGYDYGRQKGAWTFDGNTSDTIIGLFVYGIEIGDPEFLDQLPSAPLSGEYADEPTPSSVAAELGVTPDSDEQDAILDDYEAGFAMGVQDEVYDMARARLGDDDMRRILERAHRSGV